jgi:hypothetical protein
MPINNGRMTSFRGSGLEGFGSPFKDSRLKVICLHHLDTNAKDPAWM